MIRHWIERQFGDRQAFFIETVELPSHLGAIWCELHGPIVGEPPVTEDEVIYEARPGRAYVSRICRRAPFRQSLLTVIAGPHKGEPCVLYTAFGGPASPREVSDPTLPEADRAASVAFWAVHALGKRWPIDAAQPHLCGRPR